MKQRGKLWPTTSLNLVPLLLTPLSSPPSLLTPLPVTPLNVLALLLTPLSALPSRLSLLLTPLSSPLSLQTPLSALPSRLSLLLTPLSSPLSLQTPLSPLRNPGGRFSGRAGSSSYLGLPPWRLQRSLLSPVTCQRRIRSQCI